MKQKRILIVDDQQTNCKLLELIVRREGYECCCVNDGVKAFEALKQYDADLMLVDVMMPNMDGFELTRRLKADERTRGIPVILVSALDDRKSCLKVLESGAEDFVSKPVDGMELITRVRNLLRLKELNDLLSHHRQNLEIQVRNRTQELRETRLDVVRCLGRAVELRNHDTGKHIKRMSKYGQLIAQAVGLGDETAELILHASALHDIGKMGIPDSILLKPGPLTDDEWKIMKAHTTFGFQILNAENNNALMEMARIIALSHHEKWDGSGYPNGLKREKIPIEARIAALSDVFDALTSERPYKQAWSVEKAVIEINRQRDKHFDPRLVDVFNELLPEIENMRCSI